MSAHNNSFPATAGADADSTGEVGYAANTPVTDLELPTDTIGLQIVQALAEGPSPDLVADAVDGLSDAAAYDGHVALALDTDVLPDIEATLDLLTSSHQLFDVPALDVANVIDDSLPT
jgi:hypothetical protein